MDKNAIKDNVRVRTFNPRSDNDITAALAETEHDIKERLNDELNRHNGIKWWISMYVTFVRVSPEGESQTTDTVFNTETHRTFPGDPLPLAASFKDLYTQAEEFTATGSGWSVEKITKIEVHTVRHEPLKVGSYVRTPAGVKGVLNVKNRDDKCIVWSILAQLHPVEQNCERVNNYIRFEKTLNVTNVRFPTPIADIKKLEDQNDLSIHVFTYDSENGVTPRRISKFKREKHINLLLLTDNDVNHYVLIKSFRKLMKEKNPNLVFCFNCLQRFSKKGVLKTHEANCLSAKTQRTDYPNNEHVFFKSYQKQLRAPFVIYADFECFTTKTDSEKEYQRHVPSGFCYIVVSTVDKHCKGPITYTGENVVETFFDHLMEEESRIQDILASPIEMIWDNEAEIKFESEDICHICEKALLDDKVRDHDHLTGKYRGAAHNACNLKYRWSKIEPLRKYGFRIPVILHNLRGYDSHLIMEAFGKYKNRHLGCVANNNERFVTFSTGALHFIDSFQFMSSSLENLVKNLAKEGPGKFKQLCKAFPHTFKLLLRKGVFPYDFFDHPSKLDNQFLPSQDQFFSELTQTDCSQEDYAHACNVWHEFDCKTFQDYHDLYLTSDVLQLADVFENFRDMALQTYKLDPTHYCTAPSLTWDSMLR